MTEDTDPHEPPASTPERGERPSDALDELARELSGHCAEELEPDHSGTVTVKMYREVACSASRRAWGASGLTGQEFRYLSALLMYATYSRTEDNLPLSNCFPTRKKIAGNLGLDERSVDNLRASVERKGWIRVHPMQRKSDGKQTASLYQFCVPPRSPPPGHPYSAWAAGWVGPWQFSNREKSAQVVPEDHALRRRRTRAK